MTWKEKVKKVSGNQIIDGSITFANLGCSIDQDSMASNSAAHIPTQQSVKAYVDNTAPRFYENDVLNQSLTTTTSTIWAEFPTPGFTTHRVHSAKFQFNLNSGGTYRNDGIFYVCVTVPQDSTSYSLGTATYGSNPSSYVSVITFPGDITQKLSMGGSIGLSADSSGYFGDRTIYAYAYDPSTNLTSVTYNSYPSAIVSQGSPVEVFFDPFHWATRGSNLIMQTYNIDVPYSSQSGFFSIETKLGYFLDQTNYKLQAREVSTGDTLSVYGFSTHLRTWSA